MRRSWPGAPGGWRAPAGRRGRGGPRAFRRGTTGRRPAGPARTTSSSSRTVAVAPSPSEMNVREMSARSGSPACQRTMTGRARRTPAGTSSTTPWLQSARVSCAKRSSAGRTEPSSSSARTRSGSRVARSAIEVRVTPAAVASGESATPVRSPSSIVSRPSVPSGRSVVDRIGSRRRRQGRVGQLDRAQVEVGRVERVRFGRQRLEGVEAGLPVGDEPGGLTGEWRDGVDVGPLHRQREVGQSLACRARPR